VKSYQKKNTSTKTSSVTQPTAAVFRYIPFE